MYLDSGRCVIFGCWKPASSRTRDGKPRCFAHMVKEPEPRGNRYERREDRR